MRRADAFAIAIISGLATIISAAFYFRTVSFDKGVLVFIFLAFVISMAAWIMEDEGFQKWLRKEHTIEW